MYSPANVEGTRTRGVAAGLVSKIPALELLHMPPGTMRLDLEPVTRTPVSFDVRMFGPDEIIIDPLEPWPYPACTPARLECVGLGGFATELRCHVDHGGSVEAEDGRPGTRLLLRCTSDELALLRGHYREQRFPLLTRGDLIPSEVLELFEASDYLELRGTKVTPSERWLRADYSSELSSDQVYCARDGALLGHVSVTRAYSRAWIGHQLTTLRGHAESFACRVALYEHFSMVPALHDGDNSHFLFGYFDRSRRWHQLFFEDFAEWIDDPSEVVSVPFERYEIDVEAPPPAPAANERPGVVIGQPPPDELVEVVDFIRPYLPPLARVAFDIEANLLDRAFLAPGHAACGMQRSRRVFTVRVEGCLVGVALCETGSPDLSLFDIFNLAQLYLAPGLSPETCAALLGFVRQYYRAHGRSRPLIVTRCGVLPCPELLGVTHVETMGCVIWSGRSLPRYRRYLDDCFARICPEALALEPATDEPRSRSVLQHDHGS